MTETTIRSVGHVKCDKCGDLCTVELAKAHGFVGCDNCGATIQYGQPRSSFRELLALFGYQLSLDWDGALVVQSPGALPDSIREWLFDHQGEIREQFERDRRRAQAVFVGGSRAGQPHGRSWCRWQRTVYEHIGRAHWEVYEFRGDDTRLWYAGRARSKAKAKRRCFVASEP